MVSDDKILAVKDRMMKLIKRHAKQFATVEEIKNAVRFIHLSHYKRLNDPKINALFEITLLNWLEHLNLTGRLYPVRGLTAELSHLLQSGLSREEAIGQIKALRNHVDDDIVDNVLSTISSVKPGMIFGTNSCLISCAVNQSTFNTIESQCSAALKRNSVVRDILHQYFGYDPAYSNRESKKRLLHVPIPIELAEQIEALPDPIEALSNINKSNRRRRRR